jgi:hypothetical protein
LRLGFDTAGRLLETVVLLFDSGNELVIHAMKARAAYIDLLDMNRRVPSRAALVPRSTPAPAWLGSPPVLGQLDLVGLVAAATDGVPVDGPDRRSPRRRPTFASATPGVSEPGGRPDGR